MIILQDYIACLILNNQRVVHINHLAWGLRTQAFRMAGKTSKACIADSGMVSLVTCY